MQNIQSINTLLTPSEVLKEIGKRVRKKREGAGLSRKDLSLKSGVSVPTISRLELHGVSTLLALIKLSFALNEVASFDSLFSPSKYESMEEFLEHER